MVCLVHCRQELQQKSWKTAKLFLQNRDQDQDQMFKTKTKTFIFVLEAPRDQDPDLEDYGGVGTGGSGGSMNRGPGLLGPPSSRATENF